MLLRLLFLLIAGIVIYRLAKSWLAKPGTKARTTSGRAPQQIDDVMVQDPVCGIYFPRREGIELLFQGQELLFCSQKCRDKFLLNSKESQ